MPFSTYEVTGGKPVELYVFDIDGVSYRLTSRETEVVLAAVNDPNGVPLDGTYESTVVGREAIAQTDEPSNSSVVIHVGMDTAFAGVFSHDRAPDSVVLVRVYRYQRDDAGQEVVAIFDGELSGWAVEGGVLELHCTPEQAVIERTVPVYVVKAGCNNVLFDSMCALSRAAFEVPGTVTFVSITGAQIKVDGAIPFADDYFANGEVVLDSTGSRRDVIASASGLLTLLKPYPEGDMAVGDTVKLYPGCDGLYNTCKVKFNNVPNFFGFDVMPVDDPFKSPQQ